MSRVVIFIILPLALCYFLFYSVGKASLPIKVGDIFVENLQSNVSVTYDKLLIPTIKAESDLDAFFAVGFLHAQNRLWQMEMNRRVASGRLSEIVGIRALNSDILMRTLDLKNIAERSLVGLSQSELKILDSYVNGVNEGIKQLKRFPLEYSILQFNPEPWTRIDSLLGLQLINLRISYNLNAEIQNALVLQSFDKEAILGLIPEDITSEIGSVPKLNAEAFTSYQFSEFINPKPLVGSNAWAVSGQHTKSGFPILANDPHLSNSIPSAFYIANIKGHLIDVSGATLPGTPFVVSGRNANVAWGITAMTADTQDIFIERVNPLNRNQYELDGKYVKMELSLTNISIKNEFLKEELPDFRLEKRRTHRGPVLSDVYSELGQVFSLRWTGDDEDGGTFSSLLKANYAQDSQEFVSALENYVAPVLNFVYADRLGNIGSIAPGKYPIRTTLHGMFPTDGWYSKNDWQDWIPSKKWPAQSNPESGIIIAANHNVISADYPFYISRNWAPSFRADRILALLKSAILKTKHNIDIQVHASIQNDIKYPLFDVVIEYISSQDIEIFTRGEQEAIEMIRLWDGLMKHNSASAAIVAAWMFNLNEQIYEDDLKRTSLPKEALNGLLAYENAALLHKVLSRSADGLCEYNFKDIHRTCDEVIQRSLRLALADLKRLLGNSMDKWHLSQLAVTHFSHFPFSGVSGADGSSGGESKFYRSIFHRTVSGFGSTESVNAKSISFVSQDKYAQHYGDSYRQIVDLASMDDHLYILSSGQSGNVLDKHYDNMIELFQAGRYSFRGSSQLHSFRILPYKTIGGIREN